MVLLSFTQQTRLYRLLLVSKNGPRGIHFAKPQTAIKALSGVSI
jgi:hypothetical protein